MEAKFCFSKETLKTVNEFVFCLLIGQTGSCFFCGRNVSCLICLFSCLWLYCYKSGQWKQKQHMPRQMRWKVLISDWRGEAKCYQNSLTSPPHTLEVWSAHLKGKVQMKHIPNFVRRSENVIKFNFWPVFVTKKYILWFFRKVHFWLYILPKRIEVKIKGGIVI